MSFRIHLNCYKCKDNSTENNLRILNDNDDTQLLYNDKYIIVVSKNINNIKLPKIIKYLYGKTITIINKNSTHINIIPFNNDTIEEEEKNEILLLKHFSLKLIANSSNTWYNTTS